MRRILSDGRSERSPPFGRERRATTLHAMDPVADPNHDAAMCIGGEAPGRRRHSPTRRPVAEPWGKSVHYHLGSRSAGLILRSGGFLQFSILHPCFVPPYRRVLRNPGRNRSSCILRSMVLRARPVAIEVAETPPCRASMTRAAPPIEICGVAMVAADGTERFGATCFGHGHSAYISVRR